MEGSRNFEYPKFDSQDKEGWEQEQKHEEELSDATDRVGKALVTTFESIRGRLSRGELLSFDDSRRFTFFRGLEHVLVEVTDYRSKSRTEDELLRAFRIRLGSSGWDSEWEWIVNESVEGNGVKFEPIILEHQETREFLTKHFGIERPDLARNGDPTVKEMEKVAEIIQDCSHRFASGERGAITYGI